MKDKAVKYEAPEEHPEIAPSAKMLYPEELSCIARTAVCVSQHAGGMTFKNFKIADVWIEQGIVVRVELSDPYCQAEAQDVLDMRNWKSFISLNNKHEDGKAWEK